MSACRFGCCDAEAASLPDGGWKSTEKGWAIDERRAEHLRREWAALSARIDKAHADYPKCPCGQRTLALDKFGLCSKTTEEHQRRRGIYAAPKTKARA